MKKVYQIGNSIAFTATVFVNYLSNTGALNHTTIGKISRNLNSLFTPAGYAFSIWGFIYLSLLGFIMYQGRSLFVKVKNDDFIFKIGPWFIVSCVVNSAWVFAWIYEYTGLSCVFIFMLLFSLLKIVLANQMQLTKVSKTTLLFLVLPFVIYSGWVAVASIANVSSYLVKINWNGFGIQPQLWTIIMILIATWLNLKMVKNRNLFGFALIGAWALIAIAVANQSKPYLVDKFAYMGGAILIIYTVFRYLKNRKLKND